MSFCCKSVCQEHLLGNQLIKSKQILRLVGLQWGKHEKGIMIMVKKQVNRTQNKRLVKVSMTMLRKWSFIDL